MPNSIVLSGWLLAIFIASHAALWVIVLSLLFRFTDFVKKQARESGHLYIGNDHSVACACCWAQTKEKV